MKRRTALSVTFVVLVLVLDVVAYPVLAIPLIVMAYFLLR